MDGPGESPEPEWAKGTEARIGEGRGDSGPEDRMWNEDAGVD